MTCLARGEIRNPEQLRAILSLKSLGWSRTAICEALKISVRTYYYRLAEAERLAAQIEECEQCDD